MQSYGYFYESNTIDLSGIYSWVSLCALGATSSLDSQKRESHISFYKIWTDHHSPFCNNFIFSPSSFFESRKQEVEEEKCQWELAHCHVS